MLWINMKKPTNIQHILKYIIHHWGVSHIFIFIDMFSCAYNNKWIQKKNLMDFHLRVIIFSSSLYYMIRNNNNLLYDDHKEQSTFNQPKTCYIKKISSLNFHPFHMRNSIYKSYLIDLTFIRANELFLNVNLGLD